MERAKGIIHKEGLDREPLAVVCDAEQSHNGGDEHKQIHADLAGEDVKDSELLSEEETESEGHAIADLGRAMAEYSEGLSETAVNFNLDYKGSEGNEPSNDGDGGNGHETHTQGHDDGTTPIIEASNLLHEHHDQPSASLLASEMAPNQSATTTESSDHNTNKILASAETNDSPQKQSHISTAESITSNLHQDIQNPNGAAMKLSQDQYDNPHVNAAASDSTEELQFSSSASSGTSSLSEDCGDPENQTSTSTQVNRDGSGSHSKTSDPQQVAFSHVDLQSSSVQMLKDVQTHPQDDSTQDPKNDAAQASTKSGDFQPSGAPLPLAINYEALKHIATYFLPVSHGACVDIRSIEGGTFHEVEVLTFADGWTCIGRFAREEERLYKVESELATMEYVRTHTQIPVPEIYFVNHNRYHVVGAAFVLMERMEGFRLNDIWYELSTQHQFSVLEQLADMIEQLAGLRFAQIGSLTAGGKVGPLVNLTRNLHEPLLGPFSNTLDFFLTGVESDVLRDGSEETKALFPVVGGELRARFAREASNPTLNPPYRLIHDDLEFFNILVTHDGKDLPPKITAIIDWDWAYTGPLHYLCEYPPPTIGYGGDEDEKPKEKLLRKHFVKALMQRYPKGSADRDNVKRCFREKCAELRSFIPMFTNYNSEKISPFNSLAKSYLSNLQRDDELDDYHPYGICEEWVPDSEPESDDD